MTEAEMDTLRERRDEITAKIVELKERIKAWEWTIAHNPTLGFLCDDLAQACDDASDQIGGFERELDEIEDQIVDRPHTPIVL